MGKDQRGKKHGLDVRRNQRLKKEQQRQAFAAQKPTAQHRGQR